VKQLECPTGSGTFELIDGALTAPTAACGESGAVEVASLIQAQASLRTCSVANSVERVNYGKRLRVSHGHQQEADG